MLVHPSLPPAHRTGRDHTDKILTDGTHDEQESLGVSVPQCIIPRCGLGVLLPCDDYERAVEEDLLRLTSGHVVFDPILLRITLPQLL